jgi:hypothetical protein
MKRFSFLLLTGLLAACSTPLPPPPPAPASAPRAAAPEAAPPAVRIETISFGREKPRALCHDERCWAENRRADFVDEWK